MYSVFILYFHFLIWVHWNTCWNITSMRRSDRTQSLHMTQGCSFIFCHNSYGVAFIQQWIYDIPFLLIDHKIISLLSCKSKQLMLLIYRIFHGKHYWSSGRAASQETEGQLKVVKEMKVIMTGTAGNEKKKRKT